MKFKKAVLVNIPTSALDEKYWKELDELVEQKVLIARDDPNYFNELHDVDCLLLGFQVPTDRDVFEAAPNLKFIGILATAFGTVDLTAAAERNIPVCNLAGYSTESVAEFSVAALLYEIRGLQEAVKRAESGNYDESGIRARELKGSNVGVIGLGSIGARFAEIISGFGAHVSYWSQHEKQVPFEYRELDDLIASSDYVSIHVAETEDTKNLLDERRLALLKPGSVIVNTVPPSVINTDALIARLQVGNIAYVTDHPDSYAEEERAKLAGLSNVTFFPAVAYISDEARIAKQEIFIANIKAALNGMPQNQVN